jgi:hypothetical protein
MADLKSNDELDQNSVQRKKISLQEAIKQKMESKLQQQGTGNKAKDYIKTNQTMRSQQTKKQNNQRKRTGV